MRDDRTPHRLSDERLAELLTRLQRSIDQTRAALALGRHIPDERVDAAFESARVLRAARAVFASQLRLIRPGPLLEGDDPPADDDPPLRVQTRFMDLIVRDLAVGAELDRRLRERDPGWFTRKLAWRDRHAALMEKWPVVAGDGGPAAARGPRAPTANGSPRPGARRPPAAG